MLNELARGTPDEESIYPYEPTFSWFNITTLAWDDRSAFWDNLSSLGAEIG